ncbi:MAG: S24 family peptidase [Cyanobacteriota bacterium]|nr:S24 family peptidase [Cyanobacteriota bacterium]
MGPLVLDDLPLGQPIPYRSAAHPDGLDLNMLLIPSPLTTFFMRVRGHRLTTWGVRDGDLLVIDRAVDPRPGHLLVVARGGRFLLRPLEVEDGRWQLASLSRTEAPIPLEGLETPSSGLFGVAVQTVRHLLKRPDAAIDGSQRARRNSHSSPLRNRG